jgi:c-di-GMP-binding flagellar brake protein YcgR
MFLFGKKKPQIKLENKQEVELEFASPDYTTVENYFTRVLACDRKKVTVQIPMKDRTPVAVKAGDNLTVTYWAGEVVSQFETTVLEKRDKEIDLAVPEKVQEDKTPDPKSEFVLEIPVPVRYRAASTPHLQTAVTKVITQTGIQLLTNVAVPRGTSLHVELEIPNSPSIKTKGRAVRSQKLDTDSRKNHLTEMEFDENITAEDRNAVFRYAIYYQQRQARKNRFQQTTQSPPKL